MLERLADFRTRTRLALVAVATVLALTAIPRDLGETVPIILLLMAPAVPIAILNAWILRKARTRGGRTG